MMRPSIEGSSSEHENHHIMHPLGSDVPIPRTPPSSGGESNELRYRPGLCQRLSHIGLCYGQRSA